MNTINEDSAARWENVAQAAKWLSEGRKVQVRAPNCTQWQDLDSENEQFRIALYPSAEYRLKPEPPKPREWILDVRPLKICVVDGDRPGEKIELVRVREVID